jgi:hypothetical protein
MTTNHENIDTLKERVAVTVGDVAAILGDKWAAEHGIVRGVTDPMMPAPPDWAMAAKQMVQEVQDRR